MGVLSEVPNSHSQYMVELGFESRAYVLWHQLLNSQLCCPCTAEETEATWIAGTALGATMAVPSFPYCDRTPGAASAQGCLWTVGLSRAHGSGRIMTQWPHFLPGAPTHKGPPTSQ